jgi:uncharacterized protein YukE
MSTTGPVTANEINVTQSAQQAFQNAVGQIRGIVSNVLESGQTLTTSAMITSAGAKFGGVVSNWCDKAGDIVNTLEWMANQLGYTAQQLQAGNQQSEEMAAALPADGSFGSGY